MKRAFAAAIVALATLCLPAAAEQSAAGYNEPNTVAARAELYRLIKEIRTVKFADKTGASSAEKPQAQKPLDPYLSEPNKAPRKATVADANAVAGGQAAKAATQVVIVKEVAPLVQDPNTVTSPFELAENLYKVGRFKEAAACYRVALSRADADKRHKLTENDQAWMLFQIGNCFVRTDPAEAIKSYRQLITDHPSSEWTPIAISREQLMQWYAANKITPKVEKPTVEKPQ
jgi:tetratricopeptide (TPR) repeat protein